MDYEEVSTKFLQKLVERDMCSFIIDRHDNPCYYKVNFETLPSDFYPIAYMLDYEYIENADWLYIVKKYNLSIAYFLNIHQVAFWGEEENFKQFIAFELNKGISLSIYEVNCGLFDIEKREIVSVYLLDRKTLLVKGDKISMEEDASVEDTLKKYFEQIKELRVKNIRVLSSYELVREVILN